MSRSRKPRYLDGEALFEARVNAGLNQAELAERAGVRQHQISGWERGHTGCQIGTVHALATALGVRPVQLLRPRDPAAPPAAGQADAA